MGGTVLVATPIRGPVELAWAMAYRRLRLPASSEEIDCPGYVIDQQRNLLVDHFLKTGHEWLFFLDADVCAPPGAVEQLLSREEKVVSGLYYRKGENSIMPFMDREEKGRIRAIEEFKIGDLVTVDYTGAGCLLVHRTVFDQVKYPWFLWTLGRPEFPKSQWVTEDYHFCRKVRAAGFLVKVDTAVRCIHLGTGRAELGGVFYPLRSSIGTGPAFDTEPVVKWAGKGK